MALSNITTDVTPVVEIYLAYMDIEGSYDDAIEVGINISDSGLNLIDAACFHAIPRNLKKFLRILSTATV